MGWGIFYYILFIFHILPVSLLPLKLNGKELTRTIFFSFRFLAGFFRPMSFFFPPFPVFFGWLDLTVIKGPVSPHYNGFVPLKTHSGVCFLASTFCFQFSDNQEKLVLIPEMMQNLFGCSLFHNQWSIGPLKLEQNLFKFFRYVCLYGVVF